MREAEIIEVSLFLINAITGREIANDLEAAEASVFELGIDSLNIISLIFQLEEKLNIEIPLTDLDESVFRSVRQLANHIGKLTVKAAA